MIVTQSNLDYLITPTRFHIGDLTGTLFTDSVILTGIVFGVKMLQTRWNNRYLIYSPSMLVNGTIINTPNGQYDVGYVPNNNDAIRNPAVTYSSQAQPIIEQSDEPAIVLAAAILIRKSAIQSSVSAFSAWSTPDLSVSNIQSGKMLVELMRGDEQALQDLFKTRLAHPRKGKFPLAATQDLTAFAPNTTSIPVSVTIYDTNNINRGNPGG
jgi:hypothetical protein